MSKIFIIEEDKFARNTLQQIISENQLDNVCTVAEAPDDKDCTYLWIKSGQNSPPADIQIKESDQFEKPLRIGALLDRINRHVAMENNPNSQDPLTIGHYQLDSRNNTLTNSKSGEVIRLTDKETHILQYLSDPPGAVVERASLLGEVWGYGENIETHTLETHIYRLRQKIEKDPAKPELLVTTDQGYKLDVK